MMRTATIVLTLLAAQVSGDQGVIPQDREEAVEAQSRPSKRTEKKPEKAVSPLVGRWADYGGLLPDPRGFVNLLRIEADGTFRFLAIDFSATEVGEEQEVAITIPAGADIRSVQTGKLDLDNGKVLLPEEDRKVGVESESFSIVDGKLRWLHIGVTDWSLDFTRVSERVQIR